MIEDTGYSFVVKFDNGSTAEVLTYSEALELLSE